MTLEEWMQENHPNVPCYPDTVPQEVWDYHEQRYNKLKEENKLLIKELEISKKLNKPIIKDLVDQVCNEDQLQRENEELKEEIDRAKAIIKRMVPKLQEHYTDEWIFFELISGD